MVQHIIANGAKNGSANGAQSASANYDHICFDFIRPLNDAMTSIAAGGGVNQNMKISIGKLKR